jgi:hypothetical protein
MFVSICRLCSIVMKIYRKFTTRFSMDEVFKISL